MEKTFLAKVCLLATFVGLFSTIGCGRRFERPLTPPVLGAIAKSGSTGKNGEPRTDYTLAAYRSDMDAYSKAVAANDLPKAKFIRNTLVYSVMAEIDNAFGDYESRLFVNQGSVLVGSDFIQLGLSTVATVSPGARGKTILTAILSGVTGTTLSVDKNFFRQQTIQAIMSSMEANRSQIKKVIMTQMQQDVDDYPVQAARSDLMSYYYAGTLPAGLESIHEDSATKASTAKSVLNDVQMRPEMRKSAKAATAAAAGGAGTSEP